MVTATNGTLQLRGVSGKVYSLNIYISDVIGAAVTMSLSGVAGTASQNFYILPENCVITDISVVTGPTVMTNLVFQINDQNIGIVTPIASVLTTLSTRATPKAPLPGNRKMTIVQA
jgi:hypothetical protein